ncbi:MAG: TonB-dependent receptor plug domain-containing protein [Gemmatimonadaceae bacterium]
MRTYLSCFVTLVLGMNACASVHPLESAEIPVNGKVITGEMIAATSAATAWDVVQQSGLFRMISDPSSGRSGVHSRRGRTSVLIAGSDVPRLIVDGARVSDLGRLREIPAGSIAWMELLGGIAGAAEEGTNSGGGVIRVVSKAGR